MEEQQLRKIFQTEEKIDLFNNTYITSKLKVKSLYTEDPLVPDVFYKLAYYIYEEDANEDEDDPVASLETTLEWITDTKSIRYLDLFHSNDKNCPLLYCYINTLFVSRGFRGQGYGTTLMEHSEERLVEVAKKFNAQTLYMSVTDVSKFAMTSDSIYMKQGFEYKSETSSSLKKVIEFEDGERIITWRITESEMETINEALDLLKKKNDRSKKRKCKSCQTE